MKSPRLQELALKADIDRISQDKLISQETKILLAELMGYADPEKSLTREVPGIEREDHYRICLKDAEALLSTGCAAEAELLLIAISFLGSSTKRPAVIKLAELYESQSAYDFTITLTRQLLVDRGADAEVAYQLAFALHMNGRSDEALEYLLPYYISDPTHRITRLCGLILKSLGMVGDSINTLTKAIESDPNDRYSILALSEVYASIGMYQNSLDTLQAVSAECRDEAINIYEAIVYRYMGEIDQSIRLLNDIIDKSNPSIDALWSQCFNYSIAGAEYSEKLLASARQYWENSGCLDPETAPKHQLPTIKQPQKLKVGFLTADIGEHVVSRFLTPLLRTYDRDRFAIEIFSTVRRYEQKSFDIASMTDSATSLQGLTLEDARSCIRGKEIDVMIDTGGFTKDSGLAILGHRCAPIQCHYIGYHASTGLATIDCFLGDALTTPQNFQWQFTERLVQIPHLWMTYDETIIFPKAMSKTVRESPVFGAFSQITKMNTQTLNYWGAAMSAIPDSILVIKDRGVQCSASRERVVNALGKHEIDPSRIYFFGPVSSHHEHLDSYNAIDIALDTTPWSGATTAFEALGMGVPLVAISGSTTSSRMSTSVVSAAGLKHLVAHSEEEFVSIAEHLARNYKQIREGKATMQKEIRSGILFDEKRICHDFFNTIDRLASGHPSHKQSPA